MLANILSSYNCHNSPETKKNVLGTKTLQCIVILNNSITS